MIAAIKCIIWNILEYLFNSYVLGDQESNKDIYIGLRTKESKLPLLSVAIILYCAINSDVQPVCNLAT